MMMIIPAIRANGMFRPGFCTSPAAIGMLFHPSYGHNAASIATPNADNKVKPPAWAVPTGVARFDHVAVPEKKKTPPTTNAMPATFKIVSADWTFPPNATVRQLIADNSKITPTATNCFDPNSQLIGFPKNMKVRAAQTWLSGKNAERKIETATPRAATEALPATMNRCQPKRNADASPYEWRR